MSTPPPRVYCIPATSAPVVAVLRRGPTEWWQVGKWDLKRLAFEPGAWFGGQLYPQKCDLSPDGRWLAYSALDFSADWSAGTIYEAVSRLPWLHALAAWEAGTTYTRGMHFVEEPGVTIGESDVGDPSPLLRRYGLALNRPEQFSVERRRGWAETADSEVRDPRDMWDERRRASMEKIRPGGGEWLLVEGSYAAFRDLANHREPALYSLRSARGVEPLEGAQWADWDAHGRLLLVTAEGCLQVHLRPDFGTAPIFDHDLAQYEPEPQPPPAWAEEW